MAKKLLASGSQNAIVNGIKFYVVELFLHIESSVELFLGNWIKWSRTHTNPIQKKVQRDAIGRLLVLISSAVVLPHCCVFDIVQTINEWLNCPWIQWDRAENYKNRRKFPLSCQRVPQLSIKWKRKDSVGIFLKISSPIRRFCSKVVTIDSNLTIPMVLLKKSQNNFSNFPTFFSVVWWFEDEHFGISVVIPPTRERWNFTIASRTKTERMIMRDGDFPHLKQPQRLNHRRVTTWKVFTT